METIRPREALEAAIKKAGGVSALADALGVTKSAIPQWRRAKVPAEHLPRIERLTGVQGSALRPDLYQLRNPPAGGQQVDAA